MSQTAFTWAFILLQVALDFYLAALAIYWIVQKRRYGTFNPFSPFQHRDFQSVRQLLLDYQAISKKAADLLEQLKEKQDQQLSHTKPIAPTATPPRDVVVLTARTPPPPSVAVPSLTQKMQKSSRQERKQLIHSLLQQGHSPESIRTQTGISLEEVQLIRALG